MSEGAIASLVAMTIARERDRFPLHLLRIRGTTAV
jgi:hypothetical protein